MSKQQPLTKGALILQEKPFAYIVKQKFAHERCDSCLSGGTGVKLMKCGGCQHAHYCGVLCQRDAWAEHKYECLCMKKIAPRIIPDAARIMAKIIWKLQYGGYLEKFYYTRNGYRKFIDLMPHLNDIKYDEKRMEHVESLFQVLKQYLAPEHLPNQTEFLGIYGRLCINSFNILDDDLNSVGTGIYLGASIFDHSSKPNAVATFDGPQISIRLIADIPELDWKNIHLSYIEPLNLPEVRNADLLKGYYFEYADENDEKTTKEMLAHAFEGEMNEEQKQQYDDVIEMTQLSLQEMQNFRCEFVV